jgi:hypothetical protein
MVLLHRYKVKFIGKGDDIWRNYGITTLDAYAMIVGANPELPVHIKAALWEQMTVNHEANRAELINNKPELENMRGYYFYGGTLVPDFLRYFRTSGIHVSAEYVAKEFSNWETVVKKTGKSSYRLQPLDHTKANPINSNGILSAVLALGNGFIPKKDAPDAALGVNHAFEGDISPLFEGGHEFYVLWSYVMTSEERTKYCGPNGAVADDFLNHLKEKEGIYYWIYAVRKDAKMGKSFLKARLAGQTPRVVPGAVQPAQAEDQDQDQDKRTREDAKQEVSESESAQEDGTITKRPRRRAAKKN